MKKIVSITFLCLALFFSLKDIVRYAVSQSDSVTYLFDLSEEESEEKSNTDEKDEIKEWEHNHNVQLLSINLEIKTEFHTLNVKKHFTPYFEITSPPPESI